MAIKVRHDGNVAPIAAAGVAGGRARKNMDAAKFANFGKSGASGGGGGGGGAMNPGTVRAPTSSASLSSAPVPRPSLERQTAAQDWLAERSDQRRFENQSALQRASDERSLDARKELADQANQFQMERDEAQNQFQMERDAQAHRNRLDVIGAEAEAWKNRTDYGYSAKQRQQYADLQGIKDSLLNSGQYSKEDIDAMMPAIEMRMNGIRDNPERMLPEDRRPVPELQFSPDGKFYFDDAGGRWTPVPETGFRITPAESFQQQRQLGAERAYYTALQNWRTAKAKYDADPDMNPDPGPQPTMQDFVGQIQSASAATPEQTIQPQPQPQPQPAPGEQTPNPQVIQSVGPNATPEEKAKRWAARLRKQ